ncbi:hypothetical protein [Brevundimonas sp. Root1279]|uniref:hypothetical protein n=1 Tax=Brevundimonas sp. Root1279 TaxID=1736443 RepID=UPI0006F5FD5F|nr:hypothetical protein [Brevundimonas sp. Root1279]KQW84040.1 hypothetical protein ASC65_05335 [Brevundimonas sp. Root1279]
MLITFMTAALLVQTGDPLAPARDGMVQCYRPNAAAKTCNAIGSYRFGADGAITNDAVNLLNADPLIVMHATAKVYVRDGAECSMIVNDPTTITAVEFNGAPLAGEQLAAAQKGIVDSMIAGLGGEGEFCTTYHPNPDGTLRAAVTIDGVAKPEAESVVLWVNPADGWRVAP